VPLVFDLWQDPQERYDIFMNNYTEHTWVLVTINAAIKDRMKTYVKYPPRKLRNEAYSGPITLPHYEWFQYVRDALAKGWVQHPDTVGELTFTLKGTGAGLCPRHVCAGPIIRI
jgi:arylsulfatase